MMGSPFYYDVLFDDGPGDVVFHDCMWSGICTCCIQMLHQDYQFTDSPDLTNKVEDLNCRTQITASNTQPPMSPQDLQNTSTTIMPSTALTTSALQNQIKTEQISTTTSTTSTLECRLPQQQHHQHQQHQHHQVNTTTTTTSASPQPDILPSSNYTSCRTSPDNSSASSSSHSSASSPSSSSPNCNSNSASPKPIRRREHNDSERKRRDHLRNAFNNLRDQVPRFKAISKKPPRIQILHEATKYVQAVMRESEEIERRLMEERSKHERLKSN